MTSRVCDRFEVFPCFVISNCYLFLEVSLLNSVLWRFLEQQENSGRERRPGEPREDSAFVGGVELVFIV